MAIPIKVKVEKVLPYTEFNFENVEWLARNYRAYRKYTQPLTIRDALIHEVEEMFLKYFGAIMAKHELIEALRIVETVYSGEDQIAFLIAIGIRKVEIEPTERGGKKIEGMKNVQYFIIYRKERSVIILPLINRNFSNWDEILSIFSNFGLQYRRKGFDELVGNVVIRKETPKKKR
ncbi:TPA: hypothetical protein H1005_00860 [archaeon]|uniref:Uncharacterized protein n=1 Tax=Candidatus Naiadarchaeum limnaeum TaxID=2756139 RepID=A0A832XLP8_9ARCH|nr:hypothetical protein [Candidatus Naiadarchaeales archaeon SRR2090153.bin1042]HIK00158.1 hypothetical protein [Candidatus Naiadarchaeum limnaeum]